MDLAGKTNAAFVFIKPHACNEKVIFFPTSNLASAKGLFRITKSMHEQVKTLVREHFKARGIRVTGTWHACVRACWLRACMRAGCMCLRVELSGLLSGSSTTAQPRALGTTTPCTKICD
jgi:hypothetical protein